MRKPVSPTGRDVADSDGVDAGKGRGLRAEAGEKRVERGGAAFDFNGDSVGIVSDEAGEASSVARR